MPDLFWKNDQEQTDKENRYEALGFLRNPFPMDPCVKPDSENDLENGKIYLESLRKTEEAQFEALLIKKNGQADAKKIALLMDYAAFRGRGIGKTAFLNHQLNRINSDFGYTISGGNESICAVYVKPGGDKNERKFWQISKLIFESIYDQKLLHVALSRIRAFTGIIGSESLKEVTKSNIYATILNSEWLKAHGVDELKLGQETKNALQRQGIDSDFITKIEYLAKGKNTFHDFFMVQKSDSYWRSNENKLLYSDLVKFFKVAGFSACVVLFDESEKIITVQNFQERRSFCDNLRGAYIDGAFENVKEHFFRLLLTVHPYSQELLNPHWSAAGLNRFVELGGDSSKHYTIFFQPLNKDSAIPLASLYLKASKIESPPSLEKTAVDTHPFEDEALQAILLKAEGIPGRYLQFLYLSIEQALEEGWTKIGVREIERVIKTDITAFQIGNDDDSENYQKTQTNLNA